MVQKNIFFVLIFFSVLTFSEEYTSILPFGDEGLDHLMRKDFNIEVTYMNYNKAVEYFTNNIYLDAMLLLGTIRQGTKYVWGGNSWKTGLDCSHFTWKIYNEVGLYYNEYKTTGMLKKVIDSDGLYDVPFEDMKFGDLLVYGYYDSQNNWRGHVVILIDPDYESEKGFKGLALGSQSGDLGVSFISYAGFPNTYRSFWYRLRKVLRIKGL